MNPGPGTRIGIPYIFYLHDFLPFWTTFLWELGFEVVVSPKTERSIIDRGLESVLSETCFPVKTAFGHIHYLIEQDVDALFIPSFVDLNDSDTKAGRGFACPYTQTVPYSARVAFRDAQILMPVIDLNQGEPFLKKELGRVLKPFGIDTRKIARSLAAARRAQEDFQQSIREKGRDVLSRITERTLVVVGRAYNSFDRGMNLNIPKKLADLGVLSVPMDFLSMAAPDISADWPNMYWRAGQRILSAARIIRAHPLLFPLYIGNFSCGPDSFIIKFFEDDIRGKPYLHIEIDEHSADAGAITRCEAFLDSIRNADSVRRKPAGNGKQQTRDRLGERTVFIPRMSDHALVLAAAFEHCGLRAEVLPESSRRTVDLGRKYVSGKECYPCAVTTGDMVGRITEQGFDPAKAAFFMPSGGGPCRFGQYNVFHRLVLKDMGLDYIPVFSPNQDEHFYEDLGIVGKDFSMRSWQGIIAVELLMKCLHETRPYEKEKGTADALYEDYLGTVYQAVRGANGNLQTVLRGARRDFEALPRHAGEKPLIGIVGEIFVRSNRFSNENLVRKIESLGGEAYLSPVEEWIYYVNAMGLRRVLIKRDWSGIINLLLKIFFQKRIEHGSARLFEGFLRSLHEPGTGDLLKNAGPYIHPSFEGEAILSIGKSIDLIRKGVSGIVNAMPFGCMPGTIVSGLMRGLNRDFAIPCLSVPYDGTESLTTAIQLEAFMDQAREYRKRNT